MSESQIAKAAQQVFGKPMRIRITAGNPVVQQPVETARKASPNEDEVMQRALSDPDVQRFREAFPNAEIRQVRNLKE
jgi:hypothetical protein